MMKRQIGIETGGLAKITHHFGNSDCQPGHSKLVPKLDFFDTQLYCQTPAFFNGCD